MLYVYGDQKSVSSQDACSVQKSNTFSLISVNSCTYSVITNF